MLSSVANIYTYRKMAEVQPTPFLGSSLTHIEESQKELAVRIRCSKMQMLFIVWAFVERNGKYIFLNVKPRFSDGEVYASKNNTPHYNFQINERR